MESSTETQSNNLQFASLILITIVVIAGTMANEWKYITSKCKREEEMIMRLNNIKEGISLAEERPRRREFYNLISEFYSSYDAIQALLRNQQITKHEANNALNNAGDKLTNDVKRLDLCRVEIRTIKSIKGYSLLLLNISKTNTISDKENIDEREGFVKINPE